MGWQAFVSILVLLASTSSALPKPTATGHKALVLISFDGFRYDTLNETLSPSITRWAEGGTVFENGVNSQAITFTAPNHLSIVTGLYEDAHGIIGNYFFDSAKKKFYDVYNLSGIAGIVKASQDPAWYEGVGDTIWESNRKGGGKSLVLHWPIGDVVNKSDTAFYPWPSDGDLSRWTKEVDQMVADIEAGVNFVAWYVSEPDYTLHAQGYYHGGHYRRVMAQLDALFQYFIGLLKARGLFDSTDIVLTADHGHAEISGLNAVLCMDHFITGQIGWDYQVSDHSIHPSSKEQALAMFENLTRAVTEHNIPVKIMWKKDIPDSWHYSHSSRVGEIVVDPAIGADARFLCPWKDAESFHSSTHGHDPHAKEMRAVLALRGPSFAEGVKIASIPENIDLYPLMAHVLGVDPAPNNGTTDSVRGALRGGVANVTNAGISSFWLILPIGALILVAIVWAIKKLRGKKSEAAPRVTEARKNLME